jgi:hypothetical protein
LRADVFLKGRCPLSPNWFWPFFCFFSHTTGTRNISLLFFYPFWYDPVQARALGSSSRICCCCTDCCFTAAVLQVYMTTSSQSRLPRSGQTRHFANQVKTWLTLWRVTTCHGSFSKADRQ